MPSIRLHPPNSSRSPPSLNPLPPLIQTPSGLALLEIQGTLHTSVTTSGVTSSTSLDDQQTSTESSIGRIVFPNYDASTLHQEDISWMKRVYLYVGKHQRLTGEVKRLGKPVALLRKRTGGKSTDVTMGMEDEDKPEEDGEQLEIVEIVKFKILFAGRPEPVGD